MTDLIVYHGSSCVGTLREAASGRMRFWYSSQWLGDNGGFPISLSMPLTAKPYDDPAHRFFANLLPEGFVRQRLCQRLGISVENDVALLEAIGGDCAGALSVLSQEPSSHDDRYELIDDALIESWAGGKAALSSVSGTGQVRLSLAGAQDKLPVKVDDQNALPSCGYSIGASAVDCRKHRNAEDRRLPAQAPALAGARAARIPASRLQTQS